ncbi:MAG: DNA double-strand break repair protein Mre11 [Salinirussus sp.]
MTRVLHTGDTHLGYRQYHVPERREDFLGAFRQVAADAVDDDVDAVVHAGDLFHDRRPALPDIMGAIDVLRTLSDAGIPFLAVVGNHESKRSAQWLDLFEALGLATRLGAEPVTIGDLAIYGLDFVPRSQRDELDLAFEPHATEHAALVTHGLFQPFDHGEWDIRELLAAMSVEVDAVLLGDNHKPGIEQINEPSSTWVTYCGSTERASADERAERGYNIIEFDGTVDIRRRGLETRPFVYVDIELGPGEGTDRVRDRVGQHDLEDVVTIVTIDGEGEPVSPAAVEEFARDRGALVARVTDRRDFPEDEEVEVSFANPDTAVRERIRDLGLSEAAKDLDELVRASDVADSMLDDAAEDHVRELVTDGDPAKFRTDSGGNTPPAEGNAVDSEDLATDEHGATGETPEKEDESRREADASTTNSDGQATMGEYL